MAWVVADRAEGPSETHLTLSEEATGISIKNLAWPANFASDPSLAHVVGLPLEILGVRMELTTTATAGNRRPTMEVWDTGTDIVGYVFSASVVPASATGAVVEFSRGFAPVFDTVEVAGSVVRSALPIGLRILPGGLLVVIQEPLVDTGDTVVVHVRARVRRG